MKILFISPSREIKGKEIVTDELERMYGIEPLGFEMLGAMVLANHDVEIIDLTYESHLREALQVFKPDIVGVTCQAMRMVYSAQDVCKKVKAYNPEILTIVGGMPVTFYPEEFNKKYIDVLVIGEGEITFKELVAAIEKKKEYKNIKGIGYRENGKLLFTSPRPLISDLNTLPLPARNLAEKYFDKYINAAIQVPIQIMYTSRGCPHNCIFCSVARFYGKKIRYQSPGRVIDELEGLKAESVEFVDDNFLQNAERVGKIVQLAKERKIHKRFMFMSGRADSIVKARHVLKDLRRMTDEMGVGVGLEGITDDWLAALKKGTSRKLNDEAIEILHDHDIHIYGSFIIGPDADREDFNKLAEYVRAKNITIPHFVPFTPMPGSASYSLNKLTLIEKDWRFYDGWHVVVSTKLPLDEFIKELNKLRNICKARALKLMMGRRKISRKERNSQDRLPLNKYDEKKEVTEEKISGHYF